MQHLDSERIASFDHDAPTPGELAHLKACPICRAERMAFSTLSKHALQLIDAPLPANMPRLTSWETLSARLRAEGLVTADAAGDQGVGNLQREPIREAFLPEKSANHVTPINARRAHATPRAGGDWWRMAAAAVMLVAGGAMWGRVSSTGSALNAGELSAAPTTAGFDVGLGNRGFNSVEEANKALAKTERDFNRISLWITANDPSANASDVLRRRLAQLDQVVASSKSALDAAPQDRVLEHYYRSAYSARELTIQQLGNALPVGRALERF